MIGKLGVDLKRCGTCLFVKPLSEFHRSPKNRGGFKSACRDCENARVRAWKRSNPDMRQRRLHRLGGFGPPGGPWVRGQHLLRSARDGLDKYAHRVDAAGDELDPH